eukprot:CAMPEP_0172512228 /NCGR_PEP_ID=MMETSP1066-20121228/242644_1 /TAXON_ID=671091 /ORGANISM="Coscinodiscus wailesii, Strain CCMP2513" /LENGTH=361 /DNA_ID=CAMNT_0013291935 /DNA_START=272 /DNA_END=1354 /DNA_ORIENTATION=-
MEAIRESERQKHELEERRVTEQYDAMQRQRTPSSQSDTATATVPSQKKKDRNAGVAVLKTIARQTRQTRGRERRVLASSDPANGSDRDDDDGSSEETSWDERAKMWLEKAAFEYDHPEALIRLGNDAIATAVAGGSSSGGGSRIVVAPSWGDDAIGRFRDEINTLNHPVEKAARLYERAGQKGSAAGWFNYGHLLWTGYPPPSNDETTSDDTTQQHAYLLPPDRDASLAAFQNAIDLNDADASFFVGTHLLSSSDNDGPRQRRRGLDLISAAAAADHGGAQYYLSLLHRNGDAGLSIPASRSAFRTYLDRACANGHAEALFLRGHSFYHGVDEDGFSRDGSAALRDFIGSADAGAADGAVA